MSSQHRAKRAAVVLAGALVVDRVASVDRIVPLGERGDLVMYTPEAGRCPTSFDQRYVLTPEEQLTWSAWTGHADPPVRRLPDEAGASRWLVSWDAGGADTPTGHTEVQVHAGSCEFTSTSYEWRVGAGAGRAQYKGKGVIAGREGTYDFILTAVDGNAPGGSGTDRLRLKVTSGDQVIYDNQGGADDAEPSTAIGGGSITVQAR